MFGFGSWLTSSSISFKLSLSTNSDRRRPKRKSICWRITRISIVLGILSPYWTFCIHWSIFQILKSSLKCEPYFSAHVPVLDDTINMGHLLQVQASGGDADSVAGDFGRHLLYKMLGYFSLVGLLRLHSLLGDYYQAVKALENIDIHRKVCCNKWIITGFVHLYVGVISEPLFFGASLPDHYGVLRRLRLHDDATLCRRHSNIQFGIVVLAKSQTAVPVSHLSKRSGT